MTPAQPSSEPPPAATAAARRHGSRACVSPNKRLRPLILGVAGLISASPAAAEVGASAAVFSEASFRGYSLSQGRPVGLLNLSYDHAKGAYAAASGSLVLGTDDGIEPLSLQLNAGYAKRLPSDLVLDLGITHSSYSSYSSRGSNSYTEIYAGVSRKALSARISYAPHYFAPGYRTLYGEADVNVSPMMKLNLNAHIGLLVPVDYPEEVGKPRAQRDWRIGVSRQTGRLSLHAFLTGGGPGRDYYRERYHNRRRLVFGLSYPL